MGERVDFKMTASELLDLMDRTPPEEWPSPRGYGYRGTTGKRLKSHHTYVVEEFLRRLEREVV